MSSTSSRQPDFRLVFGYPNVVTLWRRGTPEPVGSAVPGSPGFFDDLRFLAAEVRARRGRLTAVLPEAEVWRGRLALTGRTPLSRRRDARAVIAEVFGEDQDAIHVVLGRAGRDGGTPVAGVRRSTLDDLRDLLASVGLTTTSVVGAGGFPGFAAPPSLSRGSLRMPALRLPFAVPQLPALSGLLPRRPFALGTTGIGALTAAAGVFLLVASPRPAPVAMPEPAQIQPLAALLPPVAEPAPITLAEALPPPPPPLALRYAARPPARPELPAAVASAGRLGIPATVATRNVAFTETRAGEPLKMTLPALPARRSETQESPSPRPAITAPAKAAVLAPQTDMGLRPMSRPTAKPAAKAAAAKPETKAAPKIAPQASAAPVRGERPEPRPGEVEALVVAALTPSTQIMTDAPPSRPAVVAAPRPVPAAPVQAAKPAPKPTQVKPLVEAAVAKPAPKPVMAAAPKPAPKPAVVAAAKPAPKPVVLAAPKPVIVPAAPLVAAAAAPKAVVRTASLAPTVREVTAKPVVTSVPTPVRTPARTAAAEPVRKVAPKPVAQPAQPVRTASLAEPTVRKTAPKPQRSFGGGNASALKSGMSLIGVFGGQDGRHALVLMPDGSIERVRAGDNVRGVQVASVDESSVRLSGAGRDATLHLPE